MAMGLVRLEHNGKTPHKNGEARSGQIRRAALFLNDLASRLAGSGLIWLAHYYVGVFAVLQPLKLALNLFNHFLMVE